LIRSPLTSSFLRLSSSSATTTRRLREARRHLRRMPRRRDGSVLGAVAHGSSACCASPLRHLRAGTVVHRGDACCASPCDTPMSAQGFLKQPPGFPCGGTASAQGFLSRWSLEPTAVTREGCLSPSPSPGSSLPWSCCRQASTSATRHGGPEPAPRWSRRTTALLHAPCSSKQAPVLPLRQGGKPASVH